MKINKMKGIDITAQLRNFRMLVKSGQMDYSKAQSKAEPFLEELNCRMEKIVKKNNRFYKKAVFANFCMGFSGKGQSVFRRA